MWFCVASRVEGMRFDHRQRPSYTALSFCLYLVNEQASHCLPQRRDLRFISPRTIGDCVCVCLCVRVFVPWRTSVYVLIKAVGVGRNDCERAHVRCLPAVTVDMYVNS